MIAAYMTDQITVKHVTRDQWGAKTIVTEVLCGRIEYGSKLVCDANGEEVVSSARALFSADAEIDLADTINGRQIIAINPQRAFQTEFIKVALA